MKSIKFKELDKLNEILVKYSKEERQEILNSINEDLEKSYTHLQKSGWSITTNSENTIYGLHRKERVNNMNKYTYKRYYITCGSKYFCGTYTYQGCTYAVWGDKIDAKQYRKIDSVNAMKEKLERKHIFGDHEDRDIEIETVERESY